MLKEDPDFNEYFRTEIAEHLGGDASRFEELWDLVPRFRRRVRGFTRHLGIRWSRGIGDGLFCVKTGEEYRVYYQERGAVSTPRVFSSEARAVTFVLRELGILR